MSVEIAPSFDFSSLQMLASNGFQFMAYPLDSFGLSP